MNDKKTLVIALGPAGGILAAHLAHAGFRVYGVDIWTKHVDRIRESGLAVEGFASLAPRLLEAVPDISDLQEKSFDYVVVAVKTPALPQAIATLKKLRGEFRVVVYENGLDNEEYVAAFFDRSRVLRAAVNYAGNVVCPGRIRMNFFQRPNQLGCLCGGSGCGHANELAAMMTAASLDTVVAADIRRFTWKKTILNGSISPVSALAGLTMADVMSDQGTRWMVEALARESIDVARAAGYEYGDGFFDDCIQYLLKAGRHKPSMLVDLENGHSTEIDYVNGKIAAYGRRLGVPVPFNTSMTALVTAKASHLRGEKWLDQARIDMTRVPVPEPSAVAS